MEFQVHPVYVYRSIVRETTGERRVADRTSATEAGQGWPVCQPWWTSDEAAEQQQEAMNFAGSYF
jgi:hypothetical protein